MYRPVVTICTASLTFNNSSFCLHSVFMCFVWIWEQTANISLHSINWLVFITETQCVYCEVRAGSVYIIQFNLKVFRYFNTQHNSGLWNFPVMLILTVQGVLWRTRPCSSLNWLRLYRGNLKMNWELRGCEHKGKLINFCKCLYRSNASNYLPKLLTKYFLELITSVIIPVCPNCTCRLATFVITLNKSKISLSTTWRHMRE